MATSTSQRAGIWVIAIVLTVGTLAGFLAMMIQPQNQAADNAKAAEIQKAYAKYQDELAAAQEKQAAQEKKLEEKTASLSKKYYPVFSTFEKNTGEFDKAEAEKKLATKVLKSGSGKVLTDESTYAAYYIGWLPSGKVFESSIKDTKLQTPLVARPGSTILGWLEGVRGMKLGEVRMITIPSEKAYGENGQGDIPPKTPLRFIIMPIELLDTIPQPEFPADLLGGSNG